MSPAIRIRGFPRGGTSLNIPPVEGYPHPKVIGYATLKHKVEIYVPINTPEQDKVMRETFKLFCELFGGATVNPVLGGWIMEDGTLATDKIGIVYSYAEKITLPIRKQLRKEAIRVATELKEEAVTLVIDGGVAFITP